ncbi:hypothetical protein SynPROSU1_02094 [Synechococcus sp. PROS-U-1]|nr:hypothetical protein SynPROSU1_02094 [Synechococcus sp. PROS-U-1]
MLESRSVNEWESWLQRLDQGDIEWDDKESLMFLSSVLLFLFPKRWIQEMRSASTNRFVDELH